MLGLNRKNPIATAEAALDALRRRHASVAAQLDAARGVEGAAADARRRLLIEVDTPDPKALSRSEGACRDAADRRAALEDAVRHLAAQVLAAETELATARDRAERETAAAELERRADAIDVAAEDFASAMAKVAPAYAALFSALAEAGAKHSEVGFPIGYHAVAHHVARVAVRSAMPGLLPVPVEVPGGTPAAIDAAAAARASRSDGLRQAARAIREGRAPAAIHTSEALQATPAAVPETTLVLLRGVAFNGVDGRPVHVSAGGAVLPLPVAEAALARKIGFAMGSPEAGAILALLAQQPAANLTLTAPGKVEVERGTAQEPWVDLGISLHQVEPEAA